MNYVIGDIHANIRELEKLLARLRLHTEDSLVFLGDYIDKLPHTEETLSFLHVLKKKHRCTFLRGNHEYVWDQYVNSGKWERQEFLLTYGGKEGLLSYGHDALHALETNDTATLREAMQPYFDLMEEMQDYAIIGEYIALHAGLLPHQYNQSPLVFEEVNYFVRTRDIQTQKKYMGRYTLVAGHTHLAEKPTVEPGYVNIDLGAGYGKFLGALAVEEGIVIRSDGKRFPLCIPNR